MLTFLSATLRYCQSFFSRETVGIVLTDIADSSTVTKGRGLSKAQLRVNRYT